MIKKNCIRLILLLSIMFTAQSYTLYGNDTGRHDLFHNPEIAKKKDLKLLQPVKQPLTYYLYISDFIESFIEIPTSNVISPSSTRLC